MPRLSLPLAALFSLLLLSCAGDQRSDADQRFEAFTSRYIETWLRLHPEDATALGDHRFDGRLNDYSRAGVDTDIALCEAFLDTLNMIKVEDLSPAHMIDYDILRQNLKTEIFTLQDLREWEWNPLVYNPGDALYVLIAREGTPLNDRMKALAARLTSLPNVLDAARANLTRPPSVHTETAVQQNDGVISMLSVALQPSIDKLDNPLRAELTAARDGAVAALKSYGTWLSEELLPRSDRDFRLGRDLYLKKFALRLDTDMKPEQLLTRALQDLEHTKDEMYTTALPLFTKMFPTRKAEATDRGQVVREVLNKLGEQRPDDATIVARAGTFLAEATKFVRAKDLVAVPSDPLDIIVMPEFQRGVAVAYCDAPGVLEKGGKTFFAIAPTPASWTTEKRESFYREYNDHMLKNLVVHEAMPGHFLQLAAANKAACPTLLRGIMPSGVFAEGWATYSEQCMAQAGFGGPEMKMQQLKMRLRLLINAILDQGVHVGGMSEKEGLALMMDDGFQERGEAEGKWRRACLTSTQLSTYYYGNIMINDIRDRFMAKAGASFSQRKFHDALLSYGSISPKYFPVLFKLSAPVAAK